MDRIWQHYQQRWLNAFLAVITFVLNGCGGIEHVPETHTGTVLGVYANPAPGFFVDAGLVGESEHVPRWVRVDLRGTTETYYGLTTARWEAGREIRPGDTVSLHLGRDRSRGFEISTLANVVAVAPDTPAIASVTQDR